MKLHPELLEAKAEGAIHTLFPNSSFFFFGKADEKLGEKLCLAIETNDSNQEQIAALSELLKLALARFEVPKNIYLVSAFSKTGTGKVNRPKTVQNL